MPEIKVDNQKGIVVEPSKVTASEPWRPALLLQVKPIPGFRLHWARQDELDRVLAEGWTPVKGKDLTERTTIDGTQMDSNILKRELILVKMPEELAKQRDAYYAKKAAEAIQDSVKTFEESGDKGLSYGSINITKE